MKEKLEKYDSSSMFVSGEPLMWKYTESKNEQFLVGFIDATPINPKGSYLLAKNGKILIKGTLARPHDGKVGNNGRFIISDWLNYDVRGGVFYAFDRFGSTIIEKKYSANIYNIFISPDGLHALCLCGRSNTDDSEIVSFFDLDEGKLTANIRPANGCPDDIEFCKDNLSVLLKYGNKTNDIYSFNGSKLNNDEDNNDVLSAFDHLALASDLFKKYEYKMTPKNVEKIFATLKQSLSPRTLDRYPLKKAKVYRIAGEVCDVLGNHAKTIKYFEEALKLDKNAGIKRRLSAIKKAASKKNETTNNE